MNVCAEFSTPTSGTTRCIADSRSRIASDTSSVIGKGRGSSSDSPARDVVARWSVYQANSKSR